MQRLSFVHASAIRAYCQLYYFGSIGTQKCTYIYSRIFSFWILQKTYFSNHMFHNNVCEFGGPTFQGQQQHFPGPQFAGEKSDHMVWGSGWTRLPSSCRRSCPSLLKGSFAFIFVFLGHYAFFLYISSGPTSRVVDNVLRCMRSLPSLFESSVKARGTDVATVVVPGGQGAHLPIYKEITMYTHCVKERKHSTKKLRFKSVSYHQPPPP